ncbi:MAG: TetR/AcrR family transcriptional regulator [Pseudomonadota bacterium]
MTNKNQKHELILDAAKACYLRLGVAKTTAADIAAEAGVSRATLYRRFPSHNDIFLAVLERDSWEMVEAINGRLADITDPAEHIIEGILYVLDEIVRRPLHAHVFSAAGESWALTQALGTDDMRNLSVQMIVAAPWMPAAPDKAAEQKIAYLAEWILRILTSYAATPSPLARNRDEMRELLYTTLEPTVRALMQVISTKKKTDTVKSIR